MKREGLARGLEADDCFWIANEHLVRGKTTWDPETDPPPDVAVEVDLSPSDADRMAIYAALRVPEVWRFDGETLSVHILQSDGAYRSVERSPTFPSIPVPEIAQFLQPDPANDYLGVVRSFRVWLAQFAR